MKRIKLTAGMLDAMLDSLSEMLAGEGPAAQGIYSEKESSKLMNNAERAQRWIHQTKRDRTPEAKEAKRRRRHDPIL